MNGNITAGPGGSNTIGLSPGYSSLRTPSNFDLDVAYTSFHELFQTENQ